MQHNFNHKNTINHKLTNIYICIIIQQTISINILRNQMQQTYHHQLPRYHNYKVTNKNKYCSENYYTDMHKSYVVYTKIRTTFA